MEQERVWTDHCEHPEDSYLGTVWFMEGGKRQAWDVYVYPEPEGAHLCFRYGEKPEQYISPGNLGNCIERIGLSEDHHYQRALTLVRRRLAERASALCMSRARASRDVVFETLASAFDTLRY
jgi:hypothetical protein